MLLLCPFCALNLKNISSYQQAWQEAVRPLVETRNWCFLPGSPWTTPWNDVIRPASCLNQSGRFRIWSPGMFLQRYEDLVVFVFSLLLNNFHQIYLKKKFLRINVPHLLIPDHFLNRWSLSPRLPSSFRPDGTLRRPTRHPMATETHTQTGICWICLHYRIRTAFQWIPRFPFSSPKCSFHTLCPSASLLQLWKKAVRSRPLQ